MPRARRRQNRDDARAYGFDEYEGDAPPMPYTLSQGRDNYHRKAMKTYLKQKKLFDRKMEEKMEKATPTDDDSEDDTSAPKSKKRADNPTNNAVGPSTQIHEAYRQKKAKDYEEKQKRKEEEKLKREEKSREYEEKQREIEERRLRRIQEEIEYNKRKEERQKAVQEELLRQKQTKLEQQRQQEIAEKRAKHGAPSVFSISSNYGSSNPTTPSKKKASPIATTPINSGIKVKQSGADSPLLALLSKPPPDVDALKSIQVPPTPDSQELSPLLSAYICVIPTGQPGERQAAVHTQLSHAARRRLAYSNHITKLESEVERLRQEILKRRAVVADLSEEMELEDAKTLHKKAECEKYL